MKILKTKLNKNVEASLAEEVAEGLVYDLTCEGLTHRVTVGLEGSNPLLSLQKCAERHAERLVKREEGKQKLIKAGLEVQKIKKGKTNG